MRRERKIPRWILGTVFVISAFVMLSPMALANDRPDWHDCYIDNTAWEPDEYNPCPSFGSNSKSWGYFDSELYVEIDYIYWRYTNGGSTEWQAVETFYEAWDYTYYFEFDIDIDPTGWDWLQLWADGSTDYYGGCEI